MENNPFSRLATPFMFGQVGIKPETTWTLTSMATIGLEAAWQIRCGSMGRCCIHHSGRGGFQDNAAVMGIWELPHLACQISEFKARWFKDQSQRNASQPRRRPPLRRLCPHQLLRLRPQRRQHTVALAGPLTLACICAQAMKRVIKRA